MLITLLLVLTAAAVRTDGRPGRSTGADETLVPPPWKHTLGLNRVNQTHLDLYSGYKETFDDPRGICAVKLHFNDDPSPKDDDELTVYGVNSGTGEIFYNKSMISLGFFGGKGADPGDLTGATGIAADADGNVFVADTGHNRVVRLRNMANDLAWVGSYDLKEDGIGVKAPAGVALEGGWVYVADSGNNRLLAMDVDGRVVSRISGAFHAIEPFGVAVIAETDWNFYGSQFIVVTDSLHQRLTKLTLTGVPIESRRYSEISDEPGGFDYPAIDYYSNIYVTDTVRGCIYKFDHSLHYLTRVGCGTGTTSDLIQPRGITIYRRFGQVFVAEKAGASYFWVGTDVLNLRAAWQDGTNSRSLDIRFLLTEQSNVDVRLETKDGDLVKNLEHGRSCAPGPVERRYVIGPDELPCPVAKCTYVVVVGARPTYSSKDYHSVLRKAQVRGT